MRDADQIEISAGRRLRTLAVGGVAVVVVAAALLAGGVRPQLEAPAVSRPSPSPRASLSPEPSRVDDVQFVSPSVGFAQLARRPQTAAVGLFSSHDGGRTWSHEWEGALFSFRFFDAAHGVLATAGGLQVTADGGSTWAFRGWPEPGSPAAVAFADRVTGLALFGEAPVQMGSAEAVRIYRTVDAGLHWSLAGATSGPPVGLPLLGHKSQLGMAAGGLAWLAVTDPHYLRTIYVSRDWGGYWSPIAMPAAPDSDLVAPLVTLGGAGGVLTLVVQWVLGPARSEDPGVAYSVPPGKVPSFLYLLGPDRSDWETVPLPSQPYGDLALDYRPDGGGYLLGGDLFCRLGRTGTTLCGGPGLGEVAIDRLDDLGSGILVAVDHHFGLAYRSEDAGGHWSIVELPRS
jgi:hypothetical protein